MSLLQSWSIRHLERELGKLVNAPICFLWLEVVHLFLITKFVPSDTSVEGTKNWIGLDMCIFGVCIILACALIVMLFFIYTLPQQELSQQDAFFLKFIYVLLVFTVRFVVFPSFLSADHVGNIGVLKLTHLDSTCQMIEKFVVILYWFLAGIIFLTDDSGFSEFPQRNADEAANTKKANKQIVSERDTQTDGAIDNTAHGKRVGAENDTASSGVKKGTFRKTAVHFIPVYAGGEARRRDSRSPTRSPTRRFGEPASALSGHTCRFGYMGFPKVKQPQRRETSTDNPEVLLHPTLQDSERGRRLSSALLSGDVATSDATDTTDPPTNENTTNPSGEQTKTDD